MAASDPIGDALTKIRNASRAKHPTVEVRTSKLAERLLAVLQQEGYIRTYKPIGETLPEKRFRVYLKYGKAAPAIKQIVRISTPGVRQYRKSTELPRVLQGLGTAIVTTSQGVMTEREAYKRRVGGEVVCYVW